jgi:hypothetical protein
LRRSSRRGLVLGVLLLLLAVLAARLLLGARKELVSAKVAEASGDRESQTRHLRRAMAYYLPGNPWVRQARDELLAIARRAEAAGDQATARDALLGLRSSILSLRGLFHPYAESLREVNVRLARLMTLPPERAKELETKDGQARLLERLEQPPEPRPFWAGLGLFGFFLWTLGALTLILRALRPDASILWQRFWPLAGVIVIGLVLFCWGMSRA